MEPITHALTAVAVARLGLNKTTRLALPMMVVAGVAPDLDALSALGGASAYFHANRAVTHSLVSGAVLAAGIAAIFWALGRKYEKARVAFLPALLVCAVGVATHLLLDLTTSCGVQLLWPFGTKWVAADLAGEVDPWLLILLVAGLLLPALFRMVTEEIGARPAERGQRNAAIVVLILLAVYFGARYELRTRAEGLLNSRMYHGATPQKVGAFPRAATPLTWDGVVATDNTLEQVEVPIGPPEAFDSERTRTHFKPQPSPALEAAMATTAVRQFMGFARFPIASVDRLPDGFLVTVRDLRFGHGRGRSVVVEVDLDNAARVTGVEFVFEEGSRR